MSNVKKTAGGYMQFAPGGPVRMSTILRNLRKLGHEEGAQRIEEAHKAHGSQCLEHGPLPDPIIGLLNQQVAFICPKCSDPEVLNMWIREGQAS